MEVNDRRTWALTVLMCARRRVDTGTAPRMPLEMWESVFALSKPWCRAVVAIRNPTPKPPPPDPWAFVRIFNMYYHCEF